MDEHPDDAVDVIEEMSHDVKQGLFEGVQSSLQDLPQTSAAELLAEQQRSLFSQPEEVDQEDEMVLDAYEAMLSQHYFTDCFHTLCVCV